MVEEDLCWVMLILINIISWKQDTETALLFSSSSPNDVHLFDASYLQVLYETWGPRDWGRCLLFKKPFDCKMLWLVIPYTLHTTQPVSKVKSVPCSALLQRDIKRACLTTIANPILYIQLWSSQYLHTIYCVPSGGWSITGMITSTSRIINNVPYYGRPPNAPSTLGHWSQRHEGPIVRNRETTWKKNH